MSGSDKKDEARLPIPDSPQVPRVMRSSVPPGKGYHEYLPYLRRDFIWSCGYCSITECEATGFRMGIDHYEPKSIRPELEHDYDNLNYSCEECNTLKGDRCPPETARAVGIRFYRPDTDYFDEHFSLGEIRLEGKTNTGEFTVEYLDLNRQSLRRLRTLRNRLDACQRFVAEGVLGLQHYPIDRLPQHLKGRAAKAIRFVTDAAEGISDTIEDILEQNARSPLLDEDPDAPARAAERAAHAARLRSLYAGSWRSDRTRKKD